MGGDERGTTGVLAPTWARLAAAPLLALAATQVAGCSSAFENCEATRSCSGDRDAGVEAGAGGHGIVSGTPDAGKTPLARDSTVRGGAAGGGAAGSGAVHDGGADDTLRDTDAHDGQPFTTIEAAVVHDSAIEAAVSEASAPSPTDSGGPDALVCGPGFYDCNGRSDDGCEAHVPTDPDNCGGCGTICSAVGTMQRGCALGSCKPVCDATHLSCNGNGGDGCEIQPASDPDHCGACDTVCSAVGTKQRACAQGICKPVCDATHMDCNGNGKDGCEVDIGSNPDQCGACGYACSSTQATQRRCVAGVCTPTCTSGHADCSKPARPAADDACETDLGSPSSCGACGHSCQGGACAVQICQPLALGSGLKEPLALTVDNSYVHWVDGGNAVGAGHVVRVPLLGGTPITVVTGQSYPTSIVSDGTSVYWANSLYQNASINRIPSGAGTVATLVKDATDMGSSEVLSPGPITIDASTVYWTDSFNRQIMSMPKTGGAVTVLVPVRNTNPLSIAVDATDVYYAYFDGVERIPIIGGPAPALVSASSYSYVAIDATHAYYISASGMGITRRAKTLTAAEQTVASFPTASDIHALATDGGYVYFANTSTLYRAPKAGGTPQPLSTAVTPPVSGIVVYGSAVYWANQGSSSSPTGSIMKLAL